MNFIDLPSIFRDNSVISPIPTYFQNTETPIICYKYDTPVRDIIFNFNKLLSDLDIDTDTPEARDCKKTQCIAFQQHVI